MSNVPIPENEEKRLKALNQTDLLDTSDEELFDNITYLASYICKTPIALITLVDKDRQWFKSKVGFDYKETSRDVSFCAHAITNPDDIFIINDTHKDERFSHNPLVTSDPSIRFYAGLPLVTREGYALGTLCVIDRKPRDLSREEISVLRTLRQSAINEIEFRRTIKELARTVEEKDIAKKDLLEINEKLKETVTLQSEELESVNETLENEIREHKKAEEELRNAQKMASAAAKMKTDFLSQISHEIRTPLNTVLSYISLVSESIGATTDLDVSYFFQAIEKGAKRLIRTTELILTMSQVQSGDYETIIADDDIADNILIPLIDEIKPLADEKGLRVEFLKETSRTMLPFDRNTIRQVFTHLIENAIRFTDKGVISLSLYRDENDKLNVKVTDTGKGISPEFMENIFSPFSQEETGYTRKYEGTGLGLALVRKFCELNNAEISVQSQQGRGTSFTVTFL